MYPRIVASLESQKFILEEVNGKLFLSCYEDNFSFTIVVQVLDLRSRFMSAFSEGFWACLCFQANFFQRIIL